MPRILFKEAEARMVAGFIDAGHTSLADPTPDELHPLHRLFHETQSFLKQYCRGLNYKPALRLVAHYRASLHRRLLKLKDLLDKADYDGFKVTFQNDWHSNAELLALRFATREESDNVEIVELLTTLNILHLWHIPSHTDTEAKGLETNDDAEDSSTALKVGLADADRKLKAIQDARKDLEDKLAVVKEAEAAVLQAQDAMAQAQNAMAKADIALMQSPMSFLAEDN